MDIRIIEFRTDYRPDGRAVDMVHVAAPDAYNETGQLMVSTWYPVRMLRPDGDDEGLRGQFQRARWAKIEPAYEAWKAGNTLPEYGTPLGAWGALTPQQIEVLKKAAVLTVEDLATIAEGTMMRVPLPDMRSLQKMAKMHVANQPSAALQRQVADLEAQNAAMMAVLEDLQAEKPKRGRPRKAEAESEEEAA